MTGPPKTSMASARALFAVLNPDAISAALRTSKDSSWTLNTLAACSISLNDCALPGLFNSPKTATRESFGIIYFRSSSCLPLISGDRFERPVIFPPGRARLATNPEPTGSLSFAITMGIVAVASLAGRVAAAPAVTITSTLRCTNSAARLGRRSRSRSANRYSTRMVLSST